jgi:predicted O-methyltransferase YrrM
MIQFDDKIKKVLAGYHSRMDAEMKLAQSLSFDEMMSRRNEMLLPVGEETAVFLNTLIKSSKAKTILEIGTSYGYSTVWLAEAAKANNGKLITLEIDNAKSDYAKQKINEAGLNDFVEFKVGDAVQLIKESDEIFDFVLVDLWKELYLPCLNEFYFKLSKGAWVVADNIISPPQHHNEIDLYRSRIKELDVFDTILLPIGSGIEVSQYKAK